jgi:hypothetical protein
MPTTTTELLTVALARLRDMRSAADEGSKELIAKRVAFEATIAVETISLQEQRASIAVAEDEVRLLALQAFEADNTNKKPAPGVEIKDFVTVYYEPSDAFDWALDHKLYLSLNKAEFERFAKSAPSMVAFVTVRQESKAQIATDLAKALGLAP